MAKTVLITGGAGFIGSHLADALLARGHNVRVYDNLAAQVHGGVIPSYLSPEIEFVRGDVRDPESLREALRGVDVVYHFAAAVGVGQSMYEISHYMTVNTVGTANLLQALLDSKTPVEKLVVASSMSIYGEGRYSCARCGEMAPSPRPVSQLKEKRWEVECPECAAELSPLPTDEKKPPQCSSVYALSKKDQEELCLIYGQTYGLPVVALRFFNIYGTRQALSNPYTGVAAIFASRLLNGRLPVMFEDGRQMRDFVSVHDIVQANILAMERSEADGLAVNVGSGEPIEIREVAAVLGRTMGQENAYEITERYRAGDIRHCFADVTRARELLGYRPKVQFAAAMEELAAWLKTQSAHDRVEEASAQLSSFGLTQ